MMLDGRGVGLDDICISDGCPDLLAAVGSREVYFPVARWAWIIGINILDIVDTLSGAAALLENQGVHPGTSSLPSVFPNLTNILPGIVASLERTSLRSLAGYSKPPTAAVRGCTFDRGPWPHRVRVRTSGQEPEL